MKYSITNDVITLILPSGELETLHREDDNFSSLRDALFREDWDEALSLASPKSAIKNWASGDFEVTDDDTILYKKEAIPIELAQRILSMVRNDASPDVFMNFWIRLNNNTSARSIEQLYKFLEHENIPLTDKGTFLAYKSVTQDYLDHHTKTISNKPGCTNEMPRNKISDDPNSACSYGYHVGALEYAEGFGNGSRILICEVDPADVVCVPYDCSYQKVRVCKYTVLHEYTQALPSVTWSYRDDDVSIDDCDDCDDYGDCGDPFELGRPSDIHSQPAGHPVVKPTQPDWTKFTIYPLEDFTLKQLREYARKHLKISTANSIPGGKKALIKRIRETW